MTIFSHTLNFDNLVGLLIVPASIVLAALTAGIIADRLIRRYIGHHVAVEESTWKYVLVRSMQGVPIFFSFIIGLYWAIDAVEISPTLTKLLSYLLFTSNVFSITRVIARTVDGVVTMYFERSGKNLPKTTLLNSILIGVIYAMGLRHLHRADPNGGGRRRYGGRARIAGDACQHLFGAAPHPLQAAAHR